MAQELLTPDNADVWRGLIENFIGERLQAKLNRLKDNDHDRRDKLLHDHGREIWLASAAKRVEQIQLVTHALKYMHPDARGTSIYSPPLALPDPLVGSNTEFLADDVVGNAAALDVYKFLKLNVGERTVLERCEVRDEALKAAFCDDAECADEWCRIFAEIKEDRNPPASHTLAKQIFFPLGNGSYHLLAPLYPTALAQRLHANIQEARFSDEAKAAREAHRQGGLYGSHREYPNLAKRSFGGSKPQNISQLNSERGGVGYLLASAPPHWQSQGVKPPIQEPTMFGRWLFRFRRVRELTRTLGAFLKKTAHNNAHIRDTRARLVAQIVDEVLSLARSIQAQPAGWSAQPGCRLDAVEALWLDPRRSDADMEFASRRRTGEWSDEISHRFANWMNAAIRTDRTPMGDDEAWQWESDFDKELKWFNRELDDEC